MRDGITYFAKLKENHLDQLCFLHLKKIGIKNGKPEYFAKRITFTLVDANTVFPLVKDRKMTANEKIPYTPFVVNTYETFIMEDTPLYEYYQKTYKETQLPFYMIEHLENSFGLLQHSITQLMDDILMD